MRSLSSQPAPAHAGTQGDPAATETGVTRSQGSFLQACKLLTPPHTPLLALFYLLVQWLYRSVQEQVSRQGRHKSQCVTSALLGAHTHTPGPGDQGCGRAEISEGALRGRREEQEGLSPASLLQSSERELLSPGPDRGSPATQRIT